MEVLPFLQGSGHQRVVCLGVGWGVGARLDGLEIPSPALENPHDLAGHDSLAEGELAAQGWLRVLCVPEGWVTA